MPLIVCLADFIYSRPSRMTMGVSFGVSNIAESGGKSETVYIGHIDAVDDWVRAVLSRILTNLETLRGHVRVFTAQFWDRVTSHHRLISNITPFQTAKCKFCSAQHAELFDRLDCIF